MSLRTILFQRPDLESPRAIRVHCIAHSIVSAAPSFAFAILLGWSTVWQIVGMLVGIALFIGLAVLIHQRAPFHKLATATYAGAVLHAVKVIRVAVCFAICACFLCMAPLFLQPGALFPRSAPLETIGFIGYSLFVPDQVAGILANVITQRTGLPSPQMIAPVISAPSTPEALQTAIAPLALFAQAALATFLEGIILGLLLALCALVFWIPLRVFKLVRRGET